MSRYCLMASGGFSISLRTEALSPYYVLGLLNSSLLFGRLRGMSNIFRGGWITCTKQYVGTLPIRVIDPGNPEERQHHDRIVEKVRRAVNLNERLAREKNPQERQTATRQLAALDQEIDDLLYSLYGLGGVEDIVPGNVGAGTGKRWEN